MSTLRASGRRLSARAILGTALAGVPIAAILVGWPGRLGHAFLLALVAWTGVALAAFAVRDLSAIPAAERPFGRALAIVAIPVGMAFSLGGIVMTWLATVQFARGRQLRHAGKILLPEITDGDLWAAPRPSPTTVPPEHREALAKQWRENGRTEHASVAAFAQLTSELMAVGAPPELLAAASQGALDEIRHTELCFSLARDLDGEARSPGPFPSALTGRRSPAPRTVALARLAVDSLVDGALHEGVSARVIAKLARRCADPAITAVLREIAADEGRHATHGWDVVTFCVREGGAPVIKALEGAVRALPATLESPLPAPARDGSWERYGIHGHALEREQYGLARAHLVRRVRVLARSGLGAK